MFAKNVIYCKKRRNTNKMKSICKPIWTIFIRIVKNIHCCKNICHLNMEHRNDIFYEQMTVICAFFTVAQKCWIISKIPTAYIIVHIKLVFLWKLFELSFPWSEEPIKLTEKLKKQLNWIDHPTLFFPFSNLALI